MAWTNPRDWTTGEVVTASIMNTHVRDNLNMTAPHIVTTAGDIVYATGDSALARLALGTAGYILHVGGSSAPVWTHSPSLTGVTLSGALDANGTVDADVTDFDVLSSGDIDLVSSANAAAAVYIAQSTGTSGTVKIHADTGTSVAEGAESINIVSDVGGIGLRSTANLANAINITNDGGTTGTITIFNDQGTSVTEGAASIQLLTDAGGIGIKSTANLASAILLTTDGGTTETIVIHSDQGSGVGSITLLSDAGGITLNSNSAVAVTNDLTVGGDLTVSGDTTTVNTATLSVEDPLIILASGNNAADALDIGLYGLYDTSGSQDLYSGLFRDANDSGKWKLFKDLQVAPTTTVNVSGTGYAVGTLVASLEGSVLTASQTAITGVGTIGTGVWNGTAIVQAYIGAQAINESKLEVSNGPTNGYMLTAQSGDTGGLTWAAAPSGGVGIGLVIALS